MVTGNNSEATYFGDGAAVDFSTSFYFLAASEVIVTQTVAATGVTTTLVNGVHYTLTMPAASGLNGTVHMVTAPAVDDTLYIYRQVPFTQEVDLRTSGQFDAEVHEQVMDRLTHQSQQLHRRLAVVEAQGTAGSVVAGSGLSYSGSTLNVGAGVGIQVDASNVLVSFPTGLGADNPGVSSAAPGTDGTRDVAARSDHSHTISVEFPVELSDSTLGEGSLDTLSRSDHVHAHGNRGGGSLHAVATSSVEGFMSASDKTNLDALIAATPTTEATLQTTSNTLEILDSTSPAGNTVEVLDITVIAVLADMSLAAAWRIQAVIRRVTGNVVECAAETVSTIGNEGGGFVAPETIVSTSNYRIRVTGLAATTINWKSVMRRTIYTP